MGSDEVSLRRLSKAQHEELVEILERIRREHRARVALVAQSCGRPVAYAGSGPVEDMDGLASLAASAVAASCGLAGMLGETGANLLLQSNGRDLLHIEPVGDLVLTVLFDTPHPQGLERLRARLRLKRALSEMRSLVAKGQDAPVRIPATEAEVDALLDPLGDTPP